MMRRAGILAVEDEAVTALAITSTLRPLGYSIWTASEGPEALALAEANAVDLALLDIRLAGDMDGIEVGVELRRRHDIPCVFLTAYGDEKTFGLARSADPLGYLRKPFQKDELRNTIEIALLQHRRASERGADIQVMRSALDSTSAGVIVAGRDRKIRFLNRSAEALTGYSREAAAGMSVADLVWLSGHADLLEAAAGKPRTDRNPGTGTMQAVVATRAGSRIPVEVSAARVVEENGCDSGVYVLLREPVRANAEPDPAAGALKSSSSTAGQERVKVPPPIAELTRSLQDGRYEFVACFVVERNDKVRSRYGPGPARRVLEFYSVHVGQQLLPVDHLLLWEDSSFLALLSRPGGSLEEVRMVLNREVPSKLEYYAESDCRSALLTVTGKWKVFLAPEAGEVETLVREVDSFIATVV
jgi:PAS domain S-box-containing protein